MLRTGIILIVLITIWMILLIVDIAKREKRHKNPNYFGESLSKTGHPLIRLYHNGKPYLLLIDTGATHNVIDSRVIGEFNKKFMRKDSILVSGINSNNSGAFETYRIRFDDKNNSFTDDFLAMDLSDTFSDAESEMNESVVGILGVGFLSKYALTLDFKQNTVN